jgi:hypothetical protein
MLKLFEKFIILALLNFLKMKNILVLFPVILVLFTSCKKGCTDPLAENFDAKAKKDNNSCTYISPALNEPMLIIKLKFDSTQTRLDNFGQPSTIPSGNSAQSPIFYGMSAHYIELAQTNFTQLGDGEIIYHGDETNAGGTTAVDFSKAIVKGDGEVFFEVPLKDITPDTYNWLRVSLTYQNYDVKFKANGFSLVGRLASFVGFNTYVESYLIQSQTVTLNTNKLQGYWGFETLGTVTEGQAPATTVPNPISSTSPVPAGSCVVTGDFNSPFIVTGNETENVILTISLSTNNSFEWSDANGNGVYEPLDGDTVVDMGLRGLEPIISQ